MAVGKVGKWRRECRKVEWGQARKEPTNPIQKSAAVQHRLLFPMLREELSWTHYKSLIRVENPKARQWYLNEAADTPFHQILDTDNP